MNLKDSLARVVVDVAAIHRFHQMARGLCHREGDHTKAALIARRAGASPDSS